jgi:large subunit ribosomal protein L37Ae
MAKLKKMGIAGRFGPRYGTSIRNRWRDVMVKQKSEQKCPKCFTKIKNMRAFVGVWECKKCGAKFTGGAWISESVRGKDSKRTIQGILESNK